MKQQITIIVITLFSISSTAQFNSPFTIRATPNANIVIEGIGQNDAGLGLSLDGSFFAKHKLQLLVEMNADRFFGDKSHVYNPQGRENKAAVIYSMSAGVQFFIIRQVAISLTYGPAFHSIRAVGFSTDYGFRYGLTGFFGKERRLMPKIYFVNIPTDQLTIQFCGFGFGYRLH